MSFATISSLVNPLIVGLITQDHGMSSLPHLVLIAFYGYRYPILNNIWLILVQIVIGSCSGVWIAKFLKLKPLWSMESPLDKNSWFSWFITATGLLVAWIYDQEGSSIRNDIIYHVVVILAVVLMRRMISNSTFWIKIMKPKCVDGQLSYTLKLLTIPDDICRLSNYGVVLAILVSVPQILRWTNLLNNQTWATVPVIQSIKMGILVLFLVGVIMKSEKGKSAKKMTYNSTV